MQIIVNNLDTEYTDNGAGATILLLHGWGTNARSFSSLTNILSSNNRCISLSLPGFGKSENPPKAWAVEDYAAFVRQFLIKLDIDNPDVLIGHSFGGRIAVKAVATLKISPKKLVLIASAGLAEETKHAYLATGIIKIGKIVTSIPPFSIARNTLKRVMRRARASKDYTEAGALKDTFVNVVNEHLGTDAKKVRTPTLLIWGKEDAETPLTEANAFKQSIPNSELCIIPNAGHFVFQEQSRTVARAIKHFL
ncbi:alpha/beta hydrolase [Candidatus Uhrbacteria bacterium CG10_big_fil_rev_8_21_14_0_10_50_16]|uniref:Alpha/beta hydrolase n=1 Tax=Candidatus Uhrbacteria bacterium CG10_big_fil_rev_8_21_14_0_10_50_16 TaxID=1975039 RepID=A0A2H0RML5_9BACT|nr:MAG: alpha/beta hydrolase [Candidatus Uhrbacteria bacterium CG10_big_fil_rev_8_21_14_0_10_50_16]